MSKLEKSNKSKKEIKTILENLRPINDCVLVPFDMFAPPIEEFPSDNDFNQDGEKKLNKLIKFSGADLSYLKKFTVFKVDYRLPSELATVGEDEKRYRSEGVCVYDGVEIIPLRSTAFPHDEFDYEDEYGTTPVSVVCLEGGEHEIPPGFMYRNQKPDENEKREKCIRSPFDWVILRRNEIEQIQDNFEIVGRETIVSHFMRRKRKIHVGITLEEGMSESFGEIFTRWKKYAKRKLPVAFVPQLAEFFAEYHEKRKKNETDVWIYTNM